MRRKGKGSPAGRLVELDIGVDPAGHMMTTSIGNSHVLAIMSVHCAPLGAVRHIFKAYSSKAFQTSRAYNFKVF